MKYKQRAQMIRRCLSILLGRSSIAELRVPKSPRGPLGGLFDDLELMAEAAAHLSGKMPGIYVGLNPLNTSLGRRVNNQLAKVTKAVKDREIQRRRWLPIDFDPIRPPNTPSTDSEHDAALSSAKECREWLCDKGLPEPVLADSGNGAHLLYRINLPNDESSRELVKSALEEISFRFSNSSVLVDTGNFNASRIWRPYGTLNCKGKKTDERPHRRAELLEIPNKVQIVSADSLSELASTLPHASKVSRGENVDVARWIAENNVPVVAEAPWNSGYKWIVECPWNADHDNKSAYIVRFRDGGIAAGCLHKSCEGNNWPALRAHFEQRSGSAAQPEFALPLGNLSGGQKRKQAELLLELGSELELFRTPQGEGYVTFLVNDHREKHPIKGPAFEQFLRYRYFSLTRSAPRPQAVHDALAHFSAMAMFDSLRKPVFTRVAAAGETNYLDLVDDRWRAIAFDADGWRIVENPSVKFRRTQGMLPLPTPVRGGNINELRKFLNLRSDDDWILFVTALLQGLIPTGPYPVLGLHGEAGSAKTTGSRIVRAMIDPNTAPARAMPKDIRDLMIMANNSWVLPFDNLSYLPVWFSDCLCRLSTGGGFSTREIYTNAGEVIFEGQRPIILNGIEELATRTDLLDRSVLLELPVLENYREEREFWAEFEAARPRLLGALLDVAVEALRNLPEVQLTEKPRMADFAAIATAGEAALGLSTGAFIKAYNRNRTNANAVALEASPVASLICDLAEEGWDGTAAELLTNLSGMADQQVINRRSWPKTPKILSGMLRRLATALRKAGIDLDFSRDNSRQRARVISIRRRGSRARTDNDSRRDTKR